MLPRSPALLRRSAGSASPGQSGVGNRLGACKNPEHRHNWLEVKSFQRAMRIVHSDFVGTDAERKLLLSVRHIEGSEEIIPQRQGLTKVLVPVLWQHTVVNLMHARADDEAIQRSIGYPDMG